jgi:hypothetical protein
MSDLAAMHRDGFLRDLRRYCRKEGLTFVLDTARGKGGHAIVTVEGRTTTVQSSLTPGRIESLLKQLGLPKDALR